MQGLGLALAGPIRDELFRLTPLWQMPHLDMEWKEGEKRIAEMGTGGGWWGYPRVNFELTPIIKYFETLTLGVPHPYKFQYEL